MEVFTPIALASRICRDPDDDAVLGTATPGNVQYIVTGDKDLFDLKRFGSVDITSPAEFSAYEASQ